MTTCKLSPVRYEDIPRYVNPHDTNVTLALRERWKVVSTGKKITPWKTDLIGALVRYVPTFQHHILMNPEGGPPLGALGTVLRGTWVNNNSVGHNFYNFCFYNILWHGIGCSKNMSSQADFLTKTVRVIDLINEEGK